MNMKHLNMDDESERSPLLATSKHTRISVHRFVSRPLLKWGSFLMNASPKMLHAAIFIPLIVAIGLSMGVINMTREERPEKLWLVSDDWVLQDRTYRQTYAVWHYDH